MRLAIISDIHGNLIALEAVLAVLAQEEIDQMVCLGDVAATGPQPHETIARLRELNCPVVMGNTDDWLLNPHPHPVHDENSHRFTDIDFWCAEQLSPADLAYLRTFQPLLEQPIGDQVTLLCFHGSPQSNTDLIFATTSEEDLERMLSGFQATGMAGGHSHTQMLRRYKDVLLFNPGSIGMPFEYSRQTGQVRNPPWAEYALLSWIDGQASLEFRRVGVDVEAIIQAVFDSGMPHAQWWTQDWA